MKIKEFFKDYEDYELTEEGIKELEKVFNLKENKIWTPKFGEVYFANNNVKLGMSEITNDDSYFDKGRIKRGNFYKTYEEAIEADNLLLAEQRVKREIERLNDGWKPDWDISGQMKYCIVYCHKYQEKHFTIQLEKYYQENKNWMYLNTYENAEQLIKDYQEDLKIIFNIKN